MTTPLETYTRPPLPTVSVYPKDVAHSVEIRAVASKLSYKISEERHTGSGEASVKDFFEKHKLEADDELIATILQEMDTLLSTDRIYDSEADRAYRAALPTLMKHLPTTPSKGYPVYQMIQFTGWLGGQVIIVDRQRFELTGRACRQCKINPEAGGLGWSGVRCVDQRNCGFNYCA